MPVIQESATGGGYGRGDGLNALQKVIIQIGGIAKSQVWIPHCQGSYVNGDDEREEEVRRSYRSCPLGLLCRK